MEVSGRARLQAYVVFLVSTFLPAAALACINEFDGEEPSLFSRYITLSLPILLPTLSSVYAHLGFLPSVMIEGRISWVRACLHFVLFILPLSFFNIILVSYFTQLGRASSFTLSMSVLFLLAFLVLVESLYLRLNRKHKFKTYVVPLVILILYAGAVYLGWVLLVIHKLLFFA